MKDIKIGDWIRFQHEGRLVIDVVDYVDSGYGYEHQFAALTANHGYVIAKNVVEVRGKESLPHA